ncbi:hypothetical protein FT663_02179 [Candidozyma haemuli var. vulneris]|uniref:DNA-directed RNA polymerase III subunit RPC3 n=1 Tax=Candidozyma haemuli TaxID=45357 RepID=A0A2V1AMD4_9ASCO|nr:hypothetical protein CXQ85_001134 [[Candida] haemuloni]KAF3990337.1 hypothetical protein FT662_02330 [[Candida] haemuloni var. vulneris]KAF3992806.1 hypothetical protein FT663_02179 [[Candida] haemuloni var. vulneris]PVH18844.1 hypothetical protein CXQ85_001134 [[Candida] haemuloni]
MAPISLSESAKTQSPSSYLYTTVASSHLGETSAIVISSLISYGRSTARILATNTGLTLKQVRTVLVSLVQLNCVFFWTEGKEVYYTFDDRGIQKLLYAGDIVTHIRTVYGDESAQIIQNVLENGSINVKEYLSSFSEEIKYETTAKLLKLYNDGWLHRLQPYNYYPLEDVWNMLFQETLKATPRSATTSEIKRVAEAKAKTKIKLNDYLSRGTDPKDVFTVEAGMQKFGPSVTVTLNLQRYEKYLRTKALTDLANSRFGLLTSKVYEACCSLVEQNSPDLHHTYLQISGLINDPEEERAYLSSIENGLIDSKRTVFNLRDVPRALSENIDLRNSILTQNFLKPAKRVHINGSASESTTKKIKLEDGSAQVVSVDNDDEEEDEGDYEADNSSAKSLSLIAEHARLLTSSATPFLLEVSPGSYTIPYMSLHKHVKQHHLSTLVKTTLGPNALRVLRCIMSMKLVDEKAISNSVLLKEKTVKNELYKLTTMNLLEIQEVPRSADRAASKTFYLFRHKAVSAYRSISDALVYDMAEILTNVAQVKSDNKILLEKCDREDVKGHEEELLLESELKMLRSLQQRELSNVGRLNRVMWLYIVFGVL